MSKVKDLTGMTFNRLYIVKRVDNDKDGRARWLCKCECGNIKEVLGKHLISSKIQSCGCLQKERITKHNMCNTRIYKEWRNMIGRCSDKSNLVYGGRGISVCDEWKKDFLSFYAWALNNNYNDKLTIDRIDSNGDYCPQNCRWVNRITQNNNLSSNRLLSYKGEIHTTAEWCRILSLNYSTVCNRLHKGWSVEKALSKRKWVNQYV